MATTSSTTTVSSTLTAAAMSTTTSQSASVTTAVLQYLQSPASVRLRRDNPHLWQGLSIRVYENIQYDDSDDQLPPQDGIYVEVSWNVDGSTAIDRNYPGKLCHNGYYYWLFTTGVDAPTSKLTRAQRAVVESFQYDDWFDFAESEDAAIDWLNQLQSVLAAVVRGHVEWSRNDASTPQVVFTIESSTVRMFDEDVKYDCDGWTVHIDDDIVTVTPRWSWSIDGVFDVMPAASVSAWSLSELTSLNVSALSVTTKSC